MLVFDVLITEIFIYLYLVRVSILEGKQIVVVTAYQLKIYISGIVVIFCNEARAFFSYELRMGTVRLDDDIPNLIHLAVQNDLFPFQIPIFISQSRETCTKGFVNVGVCTE